MNDRFGEDVPKTINLHAINDRGGRIRVAEKGNQIPFDIKRVFVVDGIEANGLRGQHAHRTCTQILVCLAGRVDVAFTDGVTSRDVVLSAPDQGLIIPPMYWSTQRYKTPRTILMVLCDEVFDASEYIRDYDEFLRYRERS
jgi:dTDP-4-dehydrorhamnose 3,5-epimerase-like enzyme